LAAVPHPCLRTSASRLPLSIGRTCVRVGRKVRPTLV
jgi:hypothetical protein